MKPSKKQTREDRFEKTFRWLKGANALDTKGEKVLKAAARKYKNFMVIGNHRSGKNTLADVLSGYLRDIGKEPMILPTVESKSIPSILKGKNWRHYQALMKSHFSTVVPIGYKDHDANLRYLPKLPQLAKNFDVVIEMRAVKGHRMVAQIWVHQHKTNTLKCLYRSASIELKDNLNAQ